MINDSGKGTYILWLRCSLPTNVKIGRFGTFALSDGWYAYVGSAMGSGGLRGRLKHHFSPLQRSHWHIDYLRQVTVCQQVWYVVSDVSHEHEWASLLGEIPGAGIPIRRFGASDCSCKSHLFHFLEPVELVTFGELSAALLKPEETIKNAMPLASITC